MIFPAVTTGRTPEPGGAHNQTLTRLARGGTLNLLGALANGLLAALVYVIVAREYPQAQAGAFFAATALFLIISAVSELGVDTGLLRWLPRYLVENRRADMSTCMRIALQPVFGACLLVGVALVVVAPWLADASVGADQRESFEQMLTVLAAGLPLAATYDLVLAQTRAYAQMRPTVVIDKFGRAILQPLAIVAVAAADGGIVAVAVAWTAPYLPALVAAVVWRDRIVSKEARGTTTVPGRARREVRSEFWRYTRARAVARICQVALQRADIVLVSALRSPREAAVYAAASRLLVFGQLGTLAVQQVMQPHLSRLLAQGDDTAAESVFKTCTSWLMTFAWPAYLASAAAAPLLLSVFGSGYGAGEEALVILSLTMLLATACGPVDIVLLMSGRSGLSLFNNAAALVVNIALNVVLIPEYGITGAAIAWAAALVVRNALPLVQVRRALGMSAVSTGAIWVAASAGLCFGLLPLLMRVTVGLGLAVALPGFVVCLAAYVALIWAGRRHLALDAFAGLLRRGSGGSPSPTTTERVAT